MSWEKMGMNWNSINTIEFIIASYSCAEF